MFLCNCFCINKQTFSKNLKSLCLAETNGYFLKWGITWRIKSSRLRTSYLSVLSEKSRLMNPHLKVLFIKKRVCALSSFWLTEKLGLVSQPTRNLSRFENEILKQPSPSIYPEIYSCILRFVLRAGILWKVYHISILVAIIHRRPKSLRGQFCLLATERLPTVFPFVYAHYVTKGSTVISQI